MVSKTSGVLLVALAVFASASYVNARTEPGRQLLTTAGEPGYCYCFANCPGAPAPTKTCDASNTPSSPSSDGVFVAACVEGIVEIYGKIGVEVYAVIVALINANIAAAVNVCIALEAYLDVFLAIFLELIVQAKGSLLLLLEADLDLLVFLCAHVDVDAHLSVLVELFLAILADVNIQLTVLAEKCIASPAVAIGKILNGCAAAVNVGDLLNLTAQNCTWYNLCKRYCGAIVNVSVDLLGLCISLGVLGK